MDVDPQITYKFNSFYHMLGFFNLFSAFLIFMFALNIPTVIPAGIILLKTISVSLTISGFVLILMYGNKDLIKIFDTHLEVKTTPVASFKVVKFYQIKNIVVTKKTIMIELKNKYKAIKIPKHLLDKTDITRVIVNLRKLVIKSI